MTEAQIVWSGQACPFRRAGVYYGMSPVATHEQVARWLLPRRGAVYTHGRLAVRQGGGAPLTYLAVRDPSAVRVVPVKGRHGGMRTPGEEFAHVSLVFTADRRATPPLTGPEVDRLEHLAAMARGAAEMDQGGFIVTIGLKVDREGEFHERVVLGRTDMTYAQLCERIMALRDEFSA